MLDRIAALLWYLVILRDIRNAIRGENPVPSLVITAWMYIGGALILAVLPPPFNIICSIPFYIFMYRIKNRMDRGIS